MKQSLLFILVAWALPSWAQPDTTAAFEAFQRADALHGEGDYGASAEAFESAATAYQAIGLVQQQVLSLLREGDNRIRNAEFDAGKTVTHQAEKLLSEQKDQFPELQGRVHMNLGLLGLYLNQPEVSKEEYSQALSWLEPLPGRDYLVTTCYNDLGVAAGQLGLYQEELAWYKKSLAIHIRVRGENDPEVASTYNNIGTAYYRLGDYASLDRYLRKAEAVLIHSLGENHPYMATVYNNLAFSSQLNGDLQECIRYYEKSLKTHLLTRGEDHSVIALVYNNIGDTYGKMGDYDKEIFYLTKALNLRLGLLGDIHNDVAVSYQNLGHAYADSGKPEKSLDAYRKALYIREQMFGERHPEVANTLMSIGEFYQHEGRFDSAFHFMQRSLAANSYTFQAGDPKNLPPINQAISFPILLEQLMMNANMWEAFAAQHNKPTAVHFALDTWVLADSLVWLRRSGLVDPNGPALLGQESRPVYEGGIRCATTLLEEQSTDELVDKLLLFIARSRAGQLWEARQSSPLAAAHQLPADWLEEEKRLTSAIDAAEQRARVVLAESGRNTTEFASAQDSVFAARQAWEAFTQRLQTAYPAFFQQRYHRPDPSLAELKQAFGGETLIAFFMGNGGLYRFGLQGEQVHVSHSPPNPELNGPFVQVLEHLRGQIQLSPEAYQQAAGTLLNHLLTPVLWEFSLAEGSSLVIVPDGPLGYLPMEAIGTTEEETFTYLSDQYRIRYQYGLLPEPTVNRERSMVFAGYAPEYVANRTDSTRAALVPLTHNEDEVSRILEEIGEGMVWTGQNASETQFRKAAPQAAILHLALHGRLNDEHPAESYLAFAQDSLNDGQLFAYEISAMNLAADLAVLSACETGSGAIQQGEGIMSLARAFQEAGCKSVLMSLWAVNDEATYEFMTRFYRFWKAGYPSAEALQRTRKAMQEETRFRDPQYWAGFVLMGESLPLPQSRSRWPWIVGGFVLALVAFGFYSRRRSKAS